MSSDKKREANRHNAEKSTGPKSAKGKAHSSSNSMKHGLYAKSFVPRGEDKKYLDELEHELRADVHPSGPVQERYFKRLIRTEWYVHQIECAILRYTETTKHEKGPPALEAVNHDADLVALKPQVDAAYERTVEARANPQGSGARPKSRTKNRKRRVEEIGRALLEGLAQPGQGGQLNQLLEQLRKLERDFDRNLKLLLGLQKNNEKEECDNPNGASE